MSPRYDAEWVSGLLDAEQRLRSTSPADLLTQNGLSPSMTAVDYGCGPGFLTLPAATIVGPEGLVYAVDIEPTMVTLVAERASEAGLQNVRAVRSVAGAAPLPDGVADFAICALVMHYPDALDGRRALTQDLARLVAPGGRLLVVQRATGGDGESRRASLAEVKGLVSEAGLDCNPHEPLVEGQYLLTATRPPAPNV